MITINSLSNHIVSDTGTTSVMGFTKNNVGENTGVY